MKKETELKEQQWKKSIEERLDKTETALDNLIEQVRQRWGKEIKRRLK